MIARPLTDEHAPYYGTYTQRVPADTDVIALMSSQPDELQHLLQNVTDEQANLRPAPGEWSIKEVLGHICDTERIFAYRGLRIARGDSKPLAGFEQNDYVLATDFNRRSLVDLVEEFGLQRRANVLCFQALTADEAARKGVASDNPISARACIYILAGHFIHHVVSLKTDYKVGS